jgi:beta-galactosidase/beta-glucuronidase
VPDNWKGKRICLNFDAVDWKSVVDLNGKKIGEHQGGYDSFSFDITDFLNEDKVQELVVSVWDPTSDGTQPRGKQVIKPHGIWYTPVTGIWQTVWIEPVSDAHIVSVKIRPDIDAGLLEIKPETSNSGTSDQIEIDVYENTKKVASVRQNAAKNPVILKIENPRLWSLCLISKGLSAAVYTQTTDVETELNGWLTYDRKVIKVDPEEMKTIHQVLFKQVLKN